MREDQTVAINFFTEDSSDVERKTKKLLEHFIKLIADSEFDEVEKLYREIKSIKYSGQGFLENLEAFDNEKQQIFNIGYAYAVIDAMQLYEKSTQKERKQPVAYEQNIILIMEAFELSGRDLAPKERDYIKEWSKMGFETDVLVEACNRTMNSINEANFMYANCILKEWKRRGVHNMEDVIELDQKYYSRKFPAQKK